jgi:adenine-specific DNA-methyltransferase
LSRNAISIWIVPAEFLDVNYGRWLKQYLTSDVTLLRLHRFEPHDLQFQDALVSSVILTFRANKPTANHEVILSGGGILLEPRFRGCVKNDKLVATEKWGPLFDGAHNQIAFAPADKSQSHIAVGDLFFVKRGIATGANDFFILTREQAADLKLPSRYLRPILPSPRNVASSVIETNSNGFPRGLPELVLIDCDLPLEQIRTEEPELFAYLQSGEEQRIDEGYLATHRGRWYRQESRPPPPIVCTYMARQTNGRGLRFIRNKSSATALNVYLLLYPKPNLASMMEANSSIIERVFEALCEAATHLIPGGRVYGGGLRKIEPRELASIRLPQWLADEYPSLIQFRLEREIATN